MTIKEVEKSTGLTAKSIRFYEEKGLIKITRDNQNDYRIFTEEDVQQLKLVKVLRYLDFSIDEILQILKYDNKKICFLIREKANELEKQSEYYQDKKEICITLAKYLKKDDFDKVIDDYSESIKFYETDEGKEIFGNFKEYFCPDISSLIISSIVLIAPIIWLFIRIHLKQWDTILGTSIIAIISTILLTMNYIYYIYYYKKHKKLIKDKNSKSILLIPLLIINVFLAIYFIIILNFILEKILAPENFLFYEPAFIPSYLMIIATVSMVIITSSALLKKTNLNNIGDLNEYAFIWDKCKWILSIAFIIITYSFLTSVTFVTEDKIIYHSPIHPLGIVYKYEDIDEIKTGFGSSNFSFIEYKKKGKFYYQIMIDNKNIIFHTPSINNNIKRYSDDTYLELEEFDNSLMKLNISKESSDDNFKYCNIDLDQRYCDRFLRIIKNR